MQKYGILSCIWKTLTCCLSCGLSLNLWSPQPLELLVEKAISTCERQMGVGESFRRLLECVASGILLEGESLTVRRDSMESLQ